MKTAEIENEVTTVLQKYVSNTTLLRPDASFVDDLELESLDVAELLIEVERRLDISIPYDNHKMDSIDDVVEAIQNSKKGNRNRLK